MLDLLLPKIGGHDVLAMIREDIGLCDLPVVILTSSDDEEDQLKAESLHVQSYITKPVNLEKFIGVLHQLKHHWHADLILPQLD